MICNPRIGQLVRLHYANKWRSWTTLHGKTGVVVKRSNGKPRNHMVEVEGRRFIVPCGNLQPIKDTTE